jgi:hypothetical protein
MATFKELGVEFKVTNDNKIKFVLHDYSGENAAHKLFTLNEFEEFQGQMAIAAAKLRGKLAKEATS